METLTQTMPATAFILSEANGQRSRENILVEHGRVLHAGELAKTEAAVSLTTTGDTHSNTTLDGLAATTGLVVGDKYAVTGSGIPAGTTFTYGGSSAGTLSAASTTTLNDTAIVLTRPAGVGAWATSADGCAGISLYDVDGTDAAVMASFLVRDAEVNQKNLVIPSGQTAGVISDLLALGIICRN